MRQNPNECPKLIHLLMRLWEEDERFIPVGVSPLMAGQRLSDPPEWTWNGSSDQGGHDVHVEMFHNWGTLDQQTLLQNSVGKIFSQGSEHFRTVFQFQGTEVSVKHLELKEVRKFKVQKTLLGNLFGALIKMIEVEWLPNHKGKDGKYYYTKGMMNHADHVYELSSLVATREMIETKIHAAEKGVQVTGGLPKSDPFAESLHCNKTFTPHVQKLKTDLAKLNRAITNKEGYVSSLDGVV